ncbi:hypothetical protein ACH79_20305 [Bradyrhizobium sp. CCBAU 051011]|nr:hypothetical protein ACH79_20305 [Bradyrhizobium sp. CCBAU 051011]
MGLWSLAEKAAVIRYFGDNALAIDRIYLVFERLFVAIVRQFLMWRPTARGLLLALFGPDRSG